VDGHPVYESSKSTKHGDAVKLRDKLLAKKSRGEVSGGSPSRVLIRELLDDVLQSDIAESTRYIWGLVIAKSLRPFFGKLKAARLTTDKMDEYRQKRKDEGCVDATVNRELTVLRTAFHNARKRTPPKVQIVPYFPMVTETNVRQGFLTDGQYTRLRDALARAGTQTALPVWIHDGYAKVRVVGLRMGVGRLRRWHNLTSGSRL
jgi:hypothetical protein